MKGCTLVVTMVVFAALGWIAEAGVRPALYELTRQTADGGGVMHSTAGRYKLSSTIGQSDDGMMTGGTYQLSGGFWFELPPGDCSDDGLVNLLDHARFQRCLRGPEIGPPDLECQCYDVDRNRVIDMKDAMTIQSYHTGP